MSAGELKALLRRDGVPTADCFEKAELGARAREAACGPLEVERPGDAEAEVQAS